MNYLESNINWEEAKRQLQTNFKPTSLGDIGGDAKWSGPNSGVIGSFFTVDVEPSESDFMDVYSLLANHATDTLKNLGFSANIRFVYKEVGSQGMLDPFSALCTFAWKTIKTDDCRHSAEKVTFKPK